MRLKAAPQGRDSRRRRRDVTRGGAAGTLTGPNGRRFEGRFSEGRRAEGVYSAGRAEAAGGEPDFDLIQRIWRVFEQVTSPQLVTAGGHGGDQSRRSRRGSRQAVTAGVTAGGHGGGHDRRSRRRSRQAVTAAVTASGHGDRSGTAGQSRQVVTKCHGKVTEKSLQGHGKIMAK